MVERRIKVVIRSGMRFNTIPGKPHDTCDISWSINCIRSNIVPEYRTLEMMLILSSS